jgi:nucleotide-binding universal stress UspA family protein
VAAGAALDDGGMTAQEEAAIVVGVDGSECGTKALRWAEEYARLRGVSLLLVTAWQWPTSYGTPLTSVGFDPEGDAKRTVEDALSTVTLPPGQVRTLVKQGHAGSVLVHAAAGALLLVVGTRGHGAFAGALLGSTGNYCVHHASGPVTIVR